MLVREAGKPVKGVRVVITGRGLSKRATTNASGKARFVIVGRSPGILQIRVPSHATCRTQRIGVLGVFTPPVTGEGTFDCRAPASAGARHSPS